MFFPSFSFFLSYLISFEFIILSLCTFVKNCLKNLSQWITLMKKHSQKCWKRESLYYEEIRENTGIFFWKKHAFAKIIFFKMKFQKNSFYHLFRFPYIVIFFFFKVNEIGILFTYINATDFKFYNSPFSYF